MTGNKNSLTQTVLQIGKHPAVPVALLVLITLLALALRLYRMGEWSFWIDEIYTIDRVQEFLASPFQLRPVSTILIAMVFQALPVSEWSARLAPALLGVFTLPILYFPVKKMFGMPVALISIFLLAISPWHLHWSQNARFYTSLLLFYNLAMLYFFFGLEEDRPVFMLLSFFFLGLAVIERKTALWYVPVVIVYLLAIVLLRFPKPAGLRTRYLTAAAVPGMFLGIYQVYLVAFTGAAPFYARFVDIFLGRQGNPMRVMMASISDIGLPIFLFALAGGLILLLQRSRAGLFMVLSFLVPLVALFAISPFAQAFSRYIFTVLPACAILAAVAIKELFTLSPYKAQVMAVGALMLLVAEPISQDLLYYSYQNGNRQDWKGAFEFVQKELQPGDAVYATRPEVGDYYLEQDVLDTDALVIKDLVSTGKRTWFVLDNRTAFSSGKRHRWVEENTRIMAVRDVYIPGIIMEMRVYLYEPQNGP